MNDIYVEKTIITKAHFLIEAQFGSLSAAVSIIPSLNLSVSVSRNSVSRVSVSRVSVSQVSVDLEPKYLRPLLFLFFRVRQGSLQRAPILIAVGYQHKTHVCKWSSAIGMLINDYRRMF